MVHNIYNIIYEFFDSHEIDINLASELYNILRKEIEVVKD